jgi:Mg-chelatase subunit ChlI
MSAETALAAAPDVPASEMPAEIAAAEAAGNVQEATALPAAEQAENTLTPALSQREREIEDAALSQKEREAAAERIRASQSLPLAMREVLARVTLASGEAATDGRARVPIDDVVRAVEEALPEFLRDRRPAEVQPHPAGDVFFSGDPEAMSDQQAEEIARQQLAKSGLLRGQRVRVAD